MTIVFLLLTTLSSIQEDGCKNHEGGGFLKEKKIAENVFLAYTSNTVKDYVIREPLVCANRIVVFIEGAGSDRKIGGYWEIRFDRETQELKISPGK